MPNSLYNQLTQTNNTSSIREALNFAKSIGNPSQALQILASKNPNVYKVLKEVQENNGDAKSLFYKKASEMGINPEEILKSLQ